MKIGIIADTHNELDPRVARAFEGVDHILHAGDVCQPVLIAELEAIAPVTVVAGNNDTHLGWREVEVLDLGGRTFLMEHIVHPTSPSPAFRTRLRHSKAQIVVFGHSHRPFCQIIDDVLYLNPGSAGAPRSKLPPSVCLLHLEGSSAPRPEFLSLDHLSPD